MENIVELYINTIQQIIETTKCEYQKSLEDIERTEKAENDIRHKIELDDRADRTEGYRLYRQQREILQERREAKDRNELLEGLYQFFMSDENKNLQDKLGKVLGGARKVYERQTKYRQYVPKEISGNTLQNHDSNPFENMLKDFKSSNKIITSGGKLRNQRG